MIPRIHFVFQSNLFPAVHWKIRSKVRESIKVDFTFGGVKDFAKRTTFFFL